MLMNLFSQKNCISSKLAMSIKGPYESYFIHCYLNYVNCVFIGLSIYSNPYPWQPVVVCLVLFFLCCPLPFCCVAEKIFQSTDFWPKPPRPKCQSVRVWMSCSSHVSISVKSIKFKDHYSGKNEITQLLLDFYFIYFHFIFALHSQEWSISNLPSNLTSNIT